MLYKINVQQPSFQLLIGTNALSYNYPDTVACKRLALFLG